MKIRYLRVSTEEQRPDRQIDGLNPLCDELHIERVSAVAKDRPVFQAVIDRLEAGDTLVVWDVDRAFRSTVDAIQQAEKLRERGIEFRIVNLGVDTSTADGMLIYTVIAALAEHERKRLSERTKEGLEAARKRGSRIGRPPSLTVRQIKNIRTKLESKEPGVRQLAARYGVHPTTIYRAVQRDEAP